MSALKIEISINSGGAVASLQQLRAALADRSEFHQVMAGAVRELITDHLTQSNRHSSAQRLGATPSGHLQKAAKRIESDGDEVAGYVRIPRDTGLNRAFTDVTLIPGSGKKFLTIPAHQRTYGKSVSDFGEGTFKFASLNTHRGIVPVLMFASNGKNKGEVAYWLRTSVKQKQDRSLLPSNEGMQQVARKDAREYIITKIFNDIA